MTIPVHVQPAVTTYNIFAIGDSGSSGEGAPTWPYSLAGNGFVDRSVWERRFDPGSTDNETRFKFPTFT